MKGMHFARVLGTTALVWLPLAAGLTGVFLFIYAAVQQNYRQSLDDPQIQMVEDAAAAIMNGTEPGQVIAAQKIDIASSLSPWLAVYTNAGVPLLSSGELNGASVQLPQGLFEQNTWLPWKTHTVPEGQETRITWQPQPDVRQAVVLLHFDSKGMTGFVAAGRNMREVEDRERNLGGMILFGWLGTLLGTLILTAVVVAVVEAFRRP